jgi:glycosyltransferase involved in cell wall biosynthesis
MSRGWGGLEMASAQWASLFQKHGHTGLSICAPGSPLEQRLKEQNLPYVTREFREYFSPMNSLWLRRYVIEQKIDVIFLQSLRDLWVVSPALWGTNIKLVGFAQMWLSGINKKDPLHTLIHNRMDALVTLTEDHCAQILKCIPFPREKTIILPNSIDTSRFGHQWRNENLRNEFGAAMNDVLIGIVGRLDRQKGQKELIEAFAKTKEKFPGKNLKLVLVGEATLDHDTSYVTELKNAVKILNLENDVRFVGFRKNIPEIMASLDLFVLASYQEAFGFVVVEALASRTPVVATRSGGVPNILQDGKYGLLAEPKNVDALTQAMVSVLSEPEKTKQRAHEAQEYTKLEFDENIIFKKLLTHLEKEI